jgi:hypothetical protein
LTILKEASASTSRGQVGRLSMADETPADPIYFLTRRLHRLGVDSRMLEQVARRFRAPDLAEGSPPHEIAAPAARPGFSPYVSTGDYLPGASLAHMYVRPEASGPGSLSEGR